MVRMPSTLGPRQVPRAARGIATIDASPVFRAQAEGARSLQAGFEGLSEGLLGAEAALYRRAMQDEEREVKQLDVEFSKQRRLINGKFKQTQGEGTVKARANLEKEYGQARDTLIQKGSNSRVKNAFGMLAQAKTEGELEQADLYTETQRRAANNTASEAVMNEAYQDAAVNWASPESMALTQKTIMQEVESQGRNNGWSADVTKSNTEAALSQMYKMQILAAAEVNPDMAVQLFDGLKDRIDGDVRVDLQKTLANITIDAISQSGAEEAIAKYPGDIKAQREYIREKWSGKKEEAMIAQLDKRLDEGRAEIRWQLMLEDQATQRLNRQLALDAKAEKALVDEAGDSLYATLREGGTRDQWERANPELAKNLIKDSYRSETLDRAATRIEIGKQYNDVTVSAAKTKYIDMDVEDLAAITEQQLEEEKANFTLQDHNALIKKVAGAKATIEGAKGASSQLFDEGQSLIRLYAPRDSKGKSKLGDTQLQDATMEMSLFIKGFTDRGKLPSHQELESEAQRLMLKVVSDPNPWQPDFVSADENISFTGLAAQARTMSDAQKAVATVPIKNIPATLKSDIIADIKAAGIAQSDALIEAMAAAIALKDQARYIQLLSGE